MIRTKGLFSRVKTENEKIDMQSLGSFDMFSWHISILFFTLTLKSVLSGKVVEIVMNELESCGFQCFTAGIGGNGVEIYLGGSS